MDKLDMHTKNLADEKYEALKDLFPNAITETINEDGEVVRAIDKDVLMQEISTNVVEGKEERYQFTWPDKKKAILNANAPINKTLRPAREESVNFDETENLYIEGDNLEVLKLLQETYLGKVKTIFIDPPYNTGQDFLYDDDFKENIDDYMDNSGQLDELGNRLDKNLESNGRYHTDWLNMMYSRLKLARELLTDDGSIFVCIDYNEVSNMRKIMDEIFGEKNFQREIIWRIGWISGYKSAAPNFIRNHDTILFYSKNKNKLYFNKEYIENRDFKPIVKDTKEVRKKLKDLGIKEDEFSEFFKFINHNNRPERYPIEDTWNSNEYDDLNSISIVSFSGEKISKILDIDDDYKGQKSIKMIERILNATIDDGDIVLDFFAGTSSTAHALLNFNKNKSKDAKYIMVQIPEEIDKDSSAFKSGFKTLCDIGKERIRRVGKKILEDNKDKEGIENLDIGFRVLKTDSSNMKDVYYSPATTYQNFLDDLEDNIKEDRTSEDLLFQVMLDLGVSLSSKIESQIIDGKEVFVVEDGFLIACFDKDVSEDTVKEIAKKEPYYAVLRDKSMASDSVAANFDQIFASISPETIRRII